MNSKDLIVSVAARIQLSEVLVRRVVRELADQVHAQLDLGTAVNVPGLGRFTPIDQPARVRQTESGEAQDVPARRVIRFKPKSQEARAKTRERRAAGGVAKRRRDEDVS
jgi:nucleoid DNA-binding protein